MNLENVLNAFQESLCFPDITGLRSFPGISKLLQQIFILEADNKRKRIELSVYAFGWGIDLLSKSGIIFNLYINKHLDVCVKYGINSHSSLV